MKKGRFSHIYIPIFLKLSFAFLLLAILPFSVTSMHIRNTSMTTLRQESLKNDQHILSLMSKNVEYRLEQINNYQKTLYDNRSFMSFFNEYPVLFSRDDLSNIKDTLHRHILNNDICNTVHIFLNNGQVISDTRFRGMEPYLKQYRELFYDQKLSSVLDQKPYGQISWLPTVTLERPGSLTNDTATFFSFGRIFRNAANTLEPIGYIIEHIDISFFDECFSFLDADNSLRFLIINPEGTIIWATDTEWNALPLNTVFPHDSQNRLNTDQIYTVNDTDYYVSEVESAYNGWIYYMLTPKSSYEAQTAPLELFSNIIVVVCFCIFVVGSWTFYRLVTKPIKRLVVHMHTLKPEDDFPVSSQLICHNSNDEIGILFQGFSEMQKRLNLMTRQKTSLHKLKLNQELLTLQAQINPHFLYNTLDAINWLSIEHRNDDICKMIQSLSRVMRYSIGKNYRTATIGDELNIILEYVYIQKCRFNNSFDMDYQIDPRVLTCHIERLLIQPFIENAIIHGIVSKHERGFVQLNIVLENDTILITIRDNGIGMTPQMITAILSGKTDSIGVYNISQFLILKYGTRYGVSITSEPLYGTTVQIRYPYLKPEE